MSERMTRIGLGIGAALIAVGMAAGAMAATQNTNGEQPAFRGGPKRGPMGPGFGMLGPIQRLGLTDAQRDQVKAIVDARAEEFKALGEKAREARRGLQEAIAADPVNDATIRQKSAEVAAIEADLAVAGAHARADVVKILTPEQRERLKTFDARRDARGGPGGRGGRGGPR